MNMVPGGPATAAAVAFAGRAMRVPQAPQNAKPTCTGLPQVGQAISALAAGFTITGVASAPSPPARGQGCGPARRASERRRGRRGRGRGRHWSPRSRSAAARAWHPPGGWVGAGTGWGRASAGESFHGMPPRGLAPGRRRRAQLTRDSGRGGARRQHRAGGLDGRLGRSRGRHPPEAAWAPVRATGRTPGAPRASRSLAAATQAKLRAGSGFSLPQRLQVIKTTPGQPMATNMAGPHRQFAPREPFLHPV